MRRCSTIIILFFPFFKIAVPPDIIIPPDDQTLLSPEATAFNCTSIGKPRADIYWISDDKVVIKDTTDKYVLNTYIMGNCTITDPPSECVSSSRLEILKTRAVDSGEYTCVASNVAGTDSASTSLIVNGEQNVIIL